MHTHDIFFQSVPIGLIVMSLTYVFLPVSGSNLNPAITFTMMCLRQISPVRTLIYIFAQCGGAISGCGTAFWIQENAYQQEQKIQLLEQHV